MTMPVNRPEHRAIGYTGPRQPLGDCGDRAVPGPAVGNSDLAPCSLLVGFGPLEGNNQALG